NGESKTVEYGKDGSETKETYTDKDGRKVSMDFDHGQRGKHTTIEEPDGHRTEIVQNPGEPAAGKRYDAQGHVVETVAYLEGKLLYTDVHNGQKRAEEFHEPTADHVAFQIRDLGKYDADTGQLTQKVGDLEFKESLADGRSEFTIPFMFNGTFGTTA